MLVDLASIYAPEDEEEILAQFEEDPTVSTMGMGIIDVNLIGPYFLPQNFNGETYEIFFVMISHHCCLMCYLHWEGRWFSSMTAAQPISAEEYEICSTKIIPSVSLAEDLGRQGFLIWHLATFTFGATWKSSFTELTAQ